MQLRDRNAVVYGGGGAIGGAMARAFAREGARVFLAGPTKAKLDAVAADLGPDAEAAVVDALDEEAVRRHAADIAGRAGGIDVCVNAVGIDSGEQGKPLAEMSADEYGAPIAAYTRTNFLTAQAAARHMATRGSGVILAVSPPMARVPTALTGSFGIAGAAVEAMCRQFATELGPDGVRVVCLRLNGIPETASRLGSHTARVWRSAAERLGIPFAELLEAVGQGSPLQRPLTVAEVADAAVFFASDRSSGLTATVANVTGGAVPD